MEDGVRDSLSFHANGSPDNTGNPLPASIQYENFFYIYGSSIAKVQIKALFIGRKSSKSFINKGLTFVDFVGTQYTQAPELLLAFKLAGSHRSCPFPLVAADDRNWLLLVDHSG